MHLPPFGLAALPLLASAASAQQVRDVPPSPIASFSEKGFDNQRSNFVIQETGPVSPLFVDGIAEYWLFAINQPGMRLMGYSLLTDEIHDEFPVGPGAVSAAMAPGTWDIWVVDSLTHTVGIIDLAKQGLVRTIDVSPGPHGIAFSDDGAQAFVTCSLSDTVDVIDTTTYAVTSHPVGVKNPRGVAFLEGLVWVAPLLSGNDTASTDPTVGGNHGVSALQRVRNLTAANHKPMPDIDLVALDPVSGGIAHKVKALGTNLFDVAVRPDKAELWIPNTEALNADVRGERNFVAGQVARNRVSIVKLDAGAPVEVTIVDLDEIAPPGASCAQPTSVSFDPTRDRAYVTGYGSDTVAILSTATDPPTWVGHYDIPPAGPGRAGPRASVVGSVLDEFLYVFNKADNSFSRIPLDQVGGSAPPAVPLGYDPTPDAIKRGRGHIISADHSKSGTTSCATCHIDGHLDGVAWGLSKWNDEEGTPNESLQFPVDIKGPMATQSLRGLAEAGTLHWRGEQGTLEDFNATFVALMERPSQLEAHEFEDLAAYVNNLAYSANSRQEPDRTWTAVQSEGRDAFVLKCAQCHQLPLGTNSDLQSLGHSRPEQGVKVAQLRGAGDREAEEHESGIATGAEGLRSSVGAGFFHNGMNPHFEAFLDVFFQGIAERNEIAAFLRAFDTGVAPAASYQFTVDPSNYGAFMTGELDYILGQAAEGNCDLVVYTRYQIEPHYAVRGAFAYDHVAGAFQAPTATVAPVAVEEVLKTVSEFQGEATFLGLPLGMGWRFGVDRDLDQLLDWDEDDAQTDPENPDYDGDDLPDGYEVLHGSDPLVADTSPDQDPPGFVVPPTLIYSTLRAAKIDLSTDELTRAEVYAVGAPDEILATSPAVGLYDVNHSLTLGPLDQDTTYDLRVRITDPAKKKTEVDVQVVTPPGTPAVYVEAISATRPGETDVVLTVDIALSTQADVPGYTVAAFAYFREGAGPLQPLAPLVFGVTDASGVVQFPVLLPTAGPVTLYVGVHDVLEPALGNWRYVEAFDAIKLLEVELPPPDVGS